jgi:hypothetical protein
MVLPTNLIEFINDRQWSLPAGTLSATHFVPDKKSLSLCQSLPVVLNALFIT